jgi:hypothetical protein
VVSGPIDLFLLHRVFKYLDACEPAVSGQPGHNQTYKVVIKLVKASALDIPTALAVLTEGNHHRCQRSWWDKEFLHKVQDASKVPGPDAEQLARHQRQRPHHVGASYTRVQVWYNAREKRTPAP